MARFEDGDFLKRGQLYGSIRTFAKRWNWSRSKAARVLKEWVSAEQIAVKTVTQSRDSRRDSYLQKPGQSPSVITICNYDTYNPQSDEGGTVGGELWDGSCSNRGTRRRNKNGDKEYMAEFEVVWKAWKGRPNNNKKAAFKAYKARRRSGVSAEDLKAGVVRYYKYLREQGKLGTEFMKTAAAFFGPNEHWKDKYNEERKAQPDLPLLNAGAGK
jgi:hypothetical protein